MFDLIGTKNMEFHEDMAQHDKVVKAAKAVKEEDIWEDVLFKFSTEIMSRRESDIVKDLIKKYKIKKR